MKDLKRNTSIVLISLAALLSCQREELPFGISEDSRISLAVAVPGTSLSSSKASGQTAYQGVINSGTEISEGLVVGMLRVDQTRKAYEADGGGIAALNFEGVTIANSSYNPKDYTFTDAQPHYYCSQANLAGNPGLRLVDFDILQYYKNDEDVVHYYGWYPYGTPDNTGTFKVNFNLDGKTDVLYSSVATQIQNEKSDTLQLHHALCQYRIWVYRMAEVGEEGTSHAAGRWGKITSITAEKQRDMATFTLPDSISYSSSTSPAPDFVLKNSLPNATIVDGVVTGATNGLYFATQEQKGSAEPTNGITIPLGINNKRQIACFLAPPPTNNHLLVKIDTDDSEESASTNRKDLSVAGNFQNGKAYDIILCFSDHGVINASVFTGEWLKYAGEIDYDVEAKMYYDLSRYGTANCYIVSSANVGYSFQGNVKGCGNGEGGGTVVGVSDCSLPDDCHVDILYQSSKDLIKLDAQSLIGGKVLFWVPGNPSDESSLALVNEGNAIIAARREKNGEILWSWHIWVTDRPLVQGYLNGYDMMDRNLGALSGPHTINQIKAADATSYGFFYQWGRKDPMIPGETGWSGASLADASECISTGIQNPLLMYKNWDVDNITSIWGYRDAQDNVKSIYDPCPPGYRAPESEAFKNLPNMKVTVTGSTGVSGGTFSGDNYNYFFYPDAGFISAKLAASYADGTKISSTGANDGHGEIYLYATAPEDFFEGQEGELVKIANLPTGSQSSGIDYHTNQAASAFSVRCISSGSKTRVINLSESATANCYIVPHFGAYKFRVDIKGNGVNKVNIGGQMWSINENADVNIATSSINHVAVLWWQGDISGRSANNTAGTDCPIKFVNEGRTLPRTPSHSSAAFGNSDITVPDEDGYVQFYIGENNWGRGNAVVAAFDVSNNILWSWHLWLTEDPEIINLGPLYNSTDNYTYEYSMMDRNLGATYHPTASEFAGQALSGNEENKTLASVGMYYQWGRKDPIQGSSSFAYTYSGSTSTDSKNWYKRNTSGDYSWTTKSSIDVSEAVLSMEGSVGNPSSFYKNTTWNTKIFFREIDPDLALFEKNWYAYKFGCNDGIIQKIINKEAVSVDQSEINKFIGRWGFNTPSSSTDPLEPSMTKTMYDPCPPGYYIPAASFLTAAGITTSAYGSNSTNQYSSSSFVWAVENSWTAGSETHGVFLRAGTSYNSGTRTVVSDSDIWIPFGGYRDYTSGRFNSTHIGSTPSAVWAIGQDFESEQYQYYSGVRSYVITASGAGQMRGIRPADGVNVRCRAY